MIFPKFKFCRKMRKSLTKLCWKIEVWAVQKHANLVDLVTSFPMHIFLQNWRRYRRERALQSLTIWLKNQMKVRYRIFQVRSPAPRGSDQSSRRHGKPGEEVRRSRKEASGARQWPARKRLEEAGVSARQHQRPPEEHRESGDGGRQGCRRRKAEARRSSAMIFLIPS